MSEGETNENSNVLQSLIPYEELLCFKKIPYDYSFLIEFARS